MMRMLRGRLWLFCVWATLALFPWFSAWGQTPFPFVQLCDPQLCRYGCEHDAATFSLAVDYINDIRPDFVLICGDLTDMAKSSDTLDQFLEIRDGLSVPCYCLVGNNDIGNTPNQTLLEDFRLRVGPDYFAFDHKGYRFIAVNTLLWESTALPGETAAQEAWFLNELQTAQVAGKPIIVAGHHPATSRASLFHQYGVVAYLCGHQHINSLLTIENVLFAVTASTCGNYDGSPLGFRLWNVDAVNPASIDSEYFSIFGFYDNRDSDGDGLSDAREDVNLNNIVDPNETDRNNPDTDGDGLNDGQELTFGFDPLQPTDASLPVGAPMALALLIGALLFAGVRQSLSSP